MKKLSFFDCGGGGKSCYNEVASKFLHFANNIANNSYINKLQNIFILFFLFISFAQARYVGASISYDINDYWMENPNNPEKDIRLDFAYGYDLLYNFRGSFSAGYGVGKNQYQNILFHLDYDIPYSIKDFNLFGGIVLGQQWIQKKQNISQFNPDATNTNYTKGVQSVNYKRNSNARGLLYGWEAGLTYTLNENIKIDYTFSIEQTEYLFFNNSKALSDTGFDRVVETVSNYVNRISVRYYF
ncbi:MAG: hypothetical protein Ta2D_02880 [Rickettsiales bacterium]|nr:MAG: hypothetical protein Ta2D_02880 [Rickettsiales bacterium]